MFCNSLVVEVTIFVMRSVGLATENIEIVVDWWQMQNLGCNKVTYLE